MSEKTKNKNSNPGKESNDAPEPIVKPEPTEEKIYYFVSDSPTLAELKPDGSIWYKFAPFFTIDPKKGEVQKGLLAVKDPVIYAYLKSSTAYGSEFIEVPYPPLRLSGGGVSIVTGAGLGRTPRSDNDLKLARELGELEARWMDGESIKSDAPSHIVARIGSLKQSLNF